MNSGTARLICFVDRQHFAGKGNGAIIAKPQEGGSGYRPVVTLATVGLHQGT